MSLEGEREPLLDPGIRAAVLAMRAAGIDTFASCDGGEGHAWPEPGVRWRGPEWQRYVAARATSEAGYKVKEVRQVWYADEGTLRQEPLWEIIFYGLPEDEG